MGNPAKKAAKYAKQTRNAARVAAVATVVSARDQRKMMRADQVSAQQAWQEQLALQRAATPTVPGWYPDAAYADFVVWFGPNNQGQLTWFPESRRHISQLQPQIPPR
jgi:hypothetical protein